MKNLTPYSRDKLSTVLFSHLTQYRMVPALYLLARERQPAEKHTQEWQHSMEKALSGVKAELSRISDYRRMSDDDILELVYEHRNLIRYTFHDMNYYHDVVRVGREHANLVGINEERMKYYLPAMAEIVNSPLIEWRMGTFDTGVEHPTILDIGSGLAPFMKLFRRDNEGHVWYIGIDKRGRGKLGWLIPEHVIPIEYVMDVDEFLSSRKDYFVNWKDNINTVFFGNSLHCMKEPVKLLEKVAKLPKVSKILIVEFSAESALNFMFNFHMYIHSGTQTIEELPTLKGWELTQSNPTTQHVLHSYTKRS